MCVLCWDEAPMRSSAHQLALEVYHNYETWKHGTDPFRVPLCSGHLGSSVRLCGRACCTAAVGLLSIRQRYGKLDLQVQDLFGQWYQKGAWWCRWCRWCRWCGWCGAREMPGRTHCGRGLDDDTGNPSRSMCFYSYRLPPKTLLAIQAQPLA